MVPLQGARRAHRTRRAGVALLALLAAALTTAPAAPAATITSSGPLTEIHISPELNCQVKHAADSLYAFYPPGSTPGSCGTFLAAGGTLYGPGTIPFGGFASPRTAWTAVSQTGPTGSGTLADPYRIVTVVQGGSLRVEQTDTYITGEEAYRTDVTVTNLATEATSGHLYRAADCYLQDSDIGFGKVDGEAVACAASLDPDARIEQWFPLTAGSSYYEAGFDEVWSRIGDQATFDDTCRCGEQLDNGAGLSWPVALTANTPQTYSHLTTFSPVGNQPLETRKVADQATTPAGGANGYEITIANPNLGDVTVDSVHDLLPAGFAYRAGTTTGATTADPVVSGQQLTWTGPFVVPSGGALVLRFDVTVADLAGTYYNEAGGDAETPYTVAPTGPTAPIEVTGLMGRMVGNASRVDMDYASIVDCDAAVANAKQRPFTIRWRESGQPREFKLASVQSVACSDDPDVPTPSTGFDTQVGQGTGTVNGVGGHELTWHLIDAGAAGDKAELTIRRTSDNAVVKAQALGPIAKRSGVNQGQNYALEP